ncbi:MAG TPA: bifunctional phosphoribosylaminoimidazolecarboxamide formyltransferase/IMP cyclohydrolase, partial [Pyrinomonadaceae bacterium]|nr:bifunctional phosphoribosylaminoimidazolecarboxamide formyltransferase/IMP cyclohydrolase [Pyrinomonadaceae bacterium]
MTLQLQPIRRALISVSDKSGIVEFAQALSRFNVEIISTGGTAKTLRDAGITVRDISEITGFPEMMDGRVKTLHPRVHGGLLAIRSNPEHVAALEKHEIQPIDLVVVNLYPFAETISREGVTRDEAIEQIDIGGPAMIRSAAKNSADVAVVVSPDQYSEIISELNEHSGALTPETRNRLAQKAFAQTAQYDLTVSSYLAGATDPLPDRLSWTMNKIADLRYGENPHQKAALYQTSTQDGIANADVLSGKEMSFNNYVDAEAAWQLVSDFEETACAIIKHTNPAGVGLGETPAAAYQKALATDPVSAFGGIVSFNRKVDAAAAREVTKIFTEVVIAPEYGDEALELLRAKKNLRVIRMSLASAQGVEFKQISGGVLVQTTDDHKLDRRQLNVVTERKPTEEEIRALLFAWIVCKHTKSHAIVYARADQTVGVGAGQMSRVDSVKIGAMRAQLPVAGSVLASDAFF